MGATQFKRAELENQEIISHYFEHHTSRSCERTFANVYLWSRQYPVKWAIIKNALVFKSEDENHVSFAYPAGAPEDVKNALEEMMEYSKAKGRPFLMYNVTPEYFAQLEEWYPGRFQIEYDRDSADYVYESEKLATLSGKKLHGKRNHINKFKKTYNYEYTPITADRIQECLDLEAEWCKANNCDQHEGTGNERRALVYALHNFEELGLTGGILHVDGKIAAFTFGMPINQDTFGVHVEKADTSIDGAYAMINYEFANHIPEQYVYLNREEDLGIEGLRKAKLSYQPAIILEKYVACLKDEPVEAIKW